MGEISNVLNGIMAMIWECVSRIVF